VNRLLSLPDPKHQQSLILPALLEHVAGFPQQIRNVDRRERVGAFEDEAVARC
jgi:hypothetical protein